MTFVTNAPSTELLLPQHEDETTEKDNKKKTTRYLKYSNIIRLEGNININELYLLHAACNYSYKIIIEKVKVPNLKNINIMYGYMGCLGHLSVLKSLSPFTSISGYYKQDFIIVQEAYCDVTLMTSPYSHSKFFRPIPQPKTQDQTNAKPKKKFPKLFVDDKEDYNDFLVNDNDVDYDNDENSDDTSSDYDSEDYADVQINEEGNN